MGFIHSYVPFVFRTACKLVFVVGMSLQIMDHIVLLPRAHPASIGVDVSKQTKLCIVGTGPSYASPGSHLSELHYQFR